MFKRFVLLSLLSTSLLFPGAFEEAFFNRCEELLTVSPGSVEVAMHKAGLCGKEEILGLFDAVEPDGDLVKIKGFKKIVATDPMSKAYALACIELKKVFRLRFEDTEAYRECIDELFNHLNYIMDNFELSEIQEESIRKISHTSYFFYYYNELGAVLKLARSTEKLEAPKGSWRTWNNLVYAGLFVIASYLVYRVVTYDGKAGERKQADRAARVTRNRYNLRNQLREGEEAAVRLGANPASFVNARIAITAAPPVEIGAIPDPGRWKGSYLDFDSEFRRFFGRVGATAQILRGARKAAPIGIGITSFVGYKALPLLMEHTGLSPTLQQTLPYMTLLFEALRSGEFVGNVSKALRGEPREAFSQLVAMLSGSLKYLNSSTPWIKKGKAERSFMYPSSEHIEGFIKTNGSFLGLEEDTVNQFLERTELFEDVVLFSFHLILSIWIYHNHWGNLPELTEYIKSNVRTFFARKHALLLKKYGKGFVVPNNKKLLNLLIDNWQKLGLIKFRLLDHGELEDYKKQALLQMSLRFKSFDGIILDLYQSLCDSKSVIAYSVLDGGEYLFKVPGERYVNPRELGDLVSIAEINKAANYSLMTRVKLTLGLYSFR